MYVYWILDFIFVYTFEIKSLYFKDTILLIFQMFYQVQSVYQTKEIGCVLIKKLQGVFFNLSSPKYTPDFK